MALLALVCSLLWGTADYLGGVLTRRRPALVVVLAMQLVGVATTGLLAGVLLVTRGGVPVGSYLWYAVGAGVAVALALAAFYQALAIGTMGVVAPVAATGVSVPVVVSWVRGERPGAAAAVGLLLAGCGVVLASGVDLRQAKSRGSAAAVGLAAMAAAGFGSVLLLVDEATSQPESSTVGLLLVMRTASAAVVGIALALRRTPVRLGRADAGPVVATGLCDVGAIAVYALAAAGDADLAVIAVLASLYPVVTALLARQLLHERLSRLQSTGVVVVLGGVAVIAASGAAG